MRVHAASLIPLLTSTALFATGCGDQVTATSPSTTTVAAASVTETFDGRVSVGGSAFYSFSVAENGTVNLTLVSVGGADMSATLGLGIGTPRGTGCTTTSTTSGEPGSAVHVTGTYGAGVYCAKVSDIGNLAAPASFTVTIAHP
jgi:hypothetical protein